MLSAANITMQFGAKPLFENINVKFGEGNRYGLIGANGCGKSTFMKILGGDLDPSAGSVVIEPNVRLGKLRQDQFAYEDLRVLDVVLMGHTAMWEAMSERDTIYANMEATEDDYMRAAELEGVFAQYDGYTSEARASELLLGVGLPIELHQGLMSAVAPGLTVRVLLAQALFSNPDVLLLDEPTNNLDIDTIRWLEHALDEKDCTMIIISHDRHFLNGVCTHMADMDFGTLTVYSGNYDDYMLASAEARARQMASNSKAKERMAELQEFVQRFAANKAKARQATSRQKMIQKIKADTVEMKPSSRQNPFIRFEQNKVLHRLALEVETISKAFDHPIITKFSTMIDAGDKVAIIGGNGVGKTTLLRVLQGDLAADSGVVKWSENADVGYMAQDAAEQFDSDELVFDWMGNFRQQGDDDQIIRGVLGKLLFSGDDVTKCVRILSGGEKHRMSFGRLLLGRHNVLMLDEPTNHLDMESIESLQLALEKYAGTVFIVSHDRQFIDNVATRIIEVKGDGTLVDFKGDYESYLDSQGLNG